MSVFWSALKAIGGLTRGVRAGFNTFASWKTRARVVAQVQNHGLFVTDHGILSRVLAIEITASEKADVIPRKASMKVRGSKTLIDITQHISLPDVVAANRTEKIVMTGDTLDKLLTQAGEHRDRVEVEICITDHYERKYESGWTEVDRADIRRSTTF